MPQDRIVEVRARNLRPLARVALNLTPLTVGIGANGSGKSSLVEACVLLKRVASDAFINEIYQGHGGAPGLFRRGTSTLALGVRIEGNGDPLEYEIELGAQGGALVVLSERLEIENGKKATKFKALTRNGNSASVFDQQKGGLETFVVDHDRTAIAAFGGRSYAQAAVPRLARALSQIEVHPALMTQPAWLARALRFDVPMRDPSLLQPAERLAVGGGNLANVYFALRNDKSDEHWRTTMDYVRLGLGTDIESINTRPDAGGGHLSLSLKRLGIEHQEPASSLSEGMLAYLAFVGILRLEAATSMLVFDEPETHLHPKLLNRVIDFTEAMSDRTSVLVLTHSDRLLDAISDPDRKVVLLDLDEQRATRIYRPDSKSLALWLHEYGTLGAVRGAGVQASVFTKEQP